MGRNYVWGVLSNDINAPNIVCTQFGSYKSVLIMVKSPLVKSSFPNLKMNACLFLDRKLIQRNGPQISLHLLSFPEAPSGGTWGTPRNIKNFVEK